MPKFRNPASPPMIQDPFRQTATACLLLALCLFPTLVFGSSVTPLGKNTGKPLSDMADLEQTARLRASALAAQEFTRALDAVTAVHGPQDLRGFTPRQAAERLRQEGWTDPLFPFAFDVAPLTLGSDQRFRSALAPVTNPETGTKADTEQILRETAPGPLAPALAEAGLASERYDVRWYVLASFAEHPGRGTQARALVQALIREPLPALVRAYALALRPLAVFNHLREGADLPGLDTTLARLANDPANLDAQCLGLLLATGTGRPFPGAEATLVLAQLARGYPVQSLEIEVRDLPPSVLETLANGLRQAWAQPQGRLISLLARFPESGPCLEALAHALLNRNHPDYSASHRTLVHTWEQLTGIPFKGNAEPYLQWYHAHKPMPALPREGS
ncbi:MAG: hypothetical protein AB7E32_01115 [Desulfovibrio sp.]